MEKICKYCGKNIVYEKPQQYGGHLTGCLKNPKRNNTLKKISDSKTKVRKNYTFICEKCGMQYDLSLTDNDYKKKKYRKNCSDKCSNSRIHSEETKKLIYNTLKGKHYGNAISGIKITKQCEICGNNFNVVPSETKRIVCKNCSKVNGRWTNEMKMLFSKRRKNYLILNPDNHPNRLCAGISESYPERMFREYFEQNGLTSGIDFEQQYPIKKYFVDFFIYKLNLGIEIDGKYWHTDTTREIERESTIKEQINLIRFDARKLIKKEYEKEINEIIRAVIA